MQGDEYLLFAEKEILERVDEYALYSHYLGEHFLIGGTYHSPIRRMRGMNDDVKPSFGIYSRKHGTGVHEFMWKDGALGIYGDIFDLVKILFEFPTRKKAMFKVMADFGIGGTSDGQIVTVDFKKVNRRYAPMTDIAVASKPFTHRDITFWNRFNINDRILDRYHVRAMKYFWTFKEQKAPYFPKGLAYSYRINNKYQLYFPGGTYDYKFLTSMDETCILGYEQLNYNTDLCIITKSLKDIMCICSFGYEAVAPRSENILLPPEFIAYLKRKYKRILVLFDNDMKHNGDLYEFEKIYIPKITDKDKDTSDFCDNHGPDECAQMLHQITNVYD